MMKKRELSKGSKGAYLSFNRPTFESQKGVFKVSREYILKANGMKNIYNCLLNSCSHMTSTIIE